MKALSLLTFLLFCLLELSSQQLTTYTNHTMSRFELNPAIAGIKQCSEINLISRRQWIGFEGAPRTNSFSYNTRLFKDDNYPDELHGLGGQLVEDRSGFIQKIHLRFAYAYHMKIWRNYRLSFGIYAGILNFTQNYASINMPNKGIDPAVDSEVNKSLIMPEVSPGMFLYGRNLFLGLSSFQVYPTRMYEIGTSEQRLNAHYFLNGGYRFRGMVLDYVPSFIVSFAPFAPPTVDLSLIIDYDQKISFALGSKYLNSGYVIVNLKLLPGLSLGYSYEYAFNELNKVAPSSQEIIISLSNCKKQKKKRKIHCPAYQ